MGFSLNPFTGFGLLDPLIEHASAKDIQQRGADVDREMFEKSTAHDIDMFNMESDFSREQMQKQYDLNQLSLQESPGSMMSGLRSAGLNPIMAATGGFRTQAPNVSSIGASAKSSSPSRGSGGSGARSNQALANKMGMLVESEAELNTARAEAERARAKQTGTVTDIAEPVAKLMQAIAGLLEQSNIDRETSSKVWKWLTKELPDKTEPLTKQEQVDMLDKAKKRFPELKGVDNAKRKIFGEK